MIVRIKNVKLRNILSVTGNFLCAFAIFAIIAAMIGIFITADANSKKVTGDYESKIFSYSAINYTQAELTAFGETVTIDFEKIDKTGSKIKEIIKISENFTPSIFTVSGELISGCLGSAGKIFAKIPSIAVYFYNQHTERK